MQLLERFWKGAVARTELPSQTFFYEVVPSAHIVVPKTLGYAWRAALTEEVWRDIVPAVLSVAGVRPSLAVSQSGPGGYQRETNPSLQCHLEIEDDDATVVAAALGWVFRQESILVADLADDTEGKTRYLIVDLGPDDLTFEQAHAFFMHADAVDPALGMGYTGFKHDLLFFNMRADNGQGEPYGLPDDVFADALRRSAETFPSRAAVTTSGTSEARFVANNWDESSDGQDYEAVLRPGMVTALRPLRDHHTRVVEAHLARQDL